MTEATSQVVEVPPADIGEGTAEAVAVDVRQIGVRGRRPHPIKAIRSLGAGIVAVGVKELRGRMRGRRAFVILTLYLLFLAGFAWAWELIAERVYGNGGSLNGGSAAFASSLIGQEIFGALLLVETLLVVFLAPAFTAGAISLEREKQTLDMLQATPISALAIVIGKLMSALTYVFILIVASIPLTAMVFVFGGVGPDEVLRGYIVLFASAIGLGALGLFISAVMQRTQAATVVTFFGVIGLTMGSLFIVLFWTTMAGISPNQAAFGNEGIGPIKGRPPEALLWYNPFAAQYDVICGASDGYGGWCSRLAGVTQGAISIGIGGGASGGSTIAPSNPVPQPAVQGGVVGPDGVLAPGGKVIVNDVGPQPVQVQPFGIRRDTFWPRSVAAWIVLSTVLILASVQLVSPTRRWRPRFLRRPFRRAA
jgi:ABC-type transport system involved in multi-copper enzyme maturation permease subunit